MLKFPSKPTRDPLFKTATGLVMTAPAVLTFIALALGIPAICTSILQTVLIGAFILFFLLALLGLTGWFQAHLVPSTVIARVFVLFGMWLERWNILMPTMTHARLIPGTTYFPTVTEIAITISTIGILTLIFVLYYRFFPSITIWKVEAGRLLELESNSRH